MKPLSLVLIILSVVSAEASTRLPVVFSDHMVLQRNQPCPVWGWDDPGQKVTVTFADQNQTSIAGSDGRWEVTLLPLETSAAPRQLHVRGSTVLTVQDVLVGEVWICAGQSNMVLKIHRSFDGDLVQLAAPNAQLRLLRVPNLGTQETRADFEGQWERTTPETVANFSAIGYYFGCELQRILGVPVGLINNAWGGSSIETWIRRESLESASNITDFAQAHRKFEAYQQTSAAPTDYENAFRQWQTDAKVARAEGNSPPPRPESPDRWRSGNKRFGNAFNGSGSPIIGYGMRGVLWYQGETNARYATSYRDLFPLLITQWRHEWGQGDFPFYWAQLADFHREPDQPGDSSWAEVREAQTLAQRLPNTGQAVITDLGESNNIHPQDKRTVALRLLRLALHHDYGFPELAYRSPEYASHRFVDQHVLVTFDTFGNTLRTFDKAEVQGFEICGPDNIWRWASARLVGKHQVKVWHDKISDPVAVRYAWADNPLCNLISRASLPATLFRTDKFVLSTSIYWPTIPEHSSPPQANAKSSEQYILGIQQGAEKSLAESGISPCQPIRQV